MKITCPLGHKCERRDEDNQVTERCQWYVMVRGANPNTNEPVDHWGCAMSFMPVMLIENTQTQRETGAAVESFRNEMVVTQKQLGAMMVGVMTGQIALPQHPSKEIEGGA